MKPDNLKLLIDGAAALGFPLSTEMTNLFADYFDEVIKHFFDSLAFAKGFAADAPLTLLDIGAGAGFPGIPLKIAFASLKIVLLDSVAKKVSFMNHVCRTLELKTIQAFHGRAEEIARRSEFAGSFDVVTLRAVTETEAAMKLAHPFLKKGGRVVMSRSSDEMRRMNDRIADYSIAGREDLVLPGSSLHRTILAIEVS